MGNSMRQIWENTDVQGYVGNDFSSIDQLLVYRVQYLDVNLDALIEGSSLSL